MGCSATTLPFGPFGKLMKQSEKVRSESESSLTEVPTYLAEEVIARFGDSMEDLGWVCARLALWSHENTLGAFSFTTPAARFTKVPGMTAAVPLATAAAPIIAWWSLSIDSARTCRSISTMGMSLPLEEV